MTQICRHGFYHVVKIGDWYRRRRGKPLRNALFVVKQEKFGMQGRLLLWQEHPFECQSNYAALAALRCNFDMHTAKSRQNIARTVSRFAIIDQLFG